MIERSPQSNKAPDLSAEHAPTDLDSALLAILAADVVDYSRLAEAEEEQTHVRLRAIRVGTVNPSIVSYRGQIVRNTGDGFLATFDSPSDAMRSALQIQREITEIETTEAPDRKIRFRMGLNVGQVIREAEDIYGTSVNVAARLEQYAPPGGIVVSDSFLKQVKHTIKVPLDDLGQLRLKNITRPVQAYSLHLADAVHDSSVTARSRKGRRARVPSIVILPFRTRGEGSDGSYFGEGMVDDIIFALSNIKGLLVISRTSALSYRTGPIDIQQIGQDLGVRYVLTGSISKHQSQLRITTELGNVETGSVIWADHYNGDLSNVFDLQDRIATRIVWSIAPHVREAELKRARRKRPESLNAYDLLMQAIDLIYRMDFTDFTRAGALLRQAIAADDSYATAYAYAALWQIHYVVQGWTHDQPADSMEAARLASAAVERDPADGFALAILGHTKSVLFHDYNAAFAIFDLALGAAPSNAMAWTLSSGVHAYTGRGQLAVERAEKGLRLSPVDRQAFFYLSFLALAHYANGTYDEAVIWGRKSMAMNDRLCANLRWLCGSLVALGQLDEARHVAQRLLQVQPRFCLSTYARLCPFEPDLRAELLRRLHVAGIPQ